MRPPVLPSGNALEVGGLLAGAGAGFNEAAGFTQRKLMPRVRASPPSGSRFNEAAGFTQRKPCSSAASPVAADPMLQ